MYTNDESVQLFACSDYYKQLRTLLSDKAKYGVFTKCTDVSCQLGHLAVNGELTKYTKICLKNLFMHNVSSKKLSSSDVYTPK